MMAKDSVKRRIEGEVGLSYTEFAYQLMQGYDFYWLYKNKNCKLQMGGSDQWGNITTGTELIRRKAGGEAFAFTCPLIKKVDGTKFGKTEQGNVWLDGNRTSPYHFYQFWLNSSDEDAVNWIRIFTFLTKDQISAIEEEHKKDPGKRVMQKALAKEITVFVHGSDEYEKAVETTNKFFSNQTAPVESLTINDLETIEGIIRSDVPKDKLQSGIDVVTLLAETGILSSKGEARKMIQGGGISINRKKVEGILTVDHSMLLHGKYILIQKGKKNYYLIQAV